MPLISAFSGSAFAFRERVSRGGENDHLEVKEAVLPLIDGIQLRSDRDALADKLLAHLGGKF